MVGFLTRIKITDNSGARVGSCIKVLGGTRHRVGTVGDVVVIAVKKVKAVKKIKKGDVRRAVVVRVRRRIVRRDGSFVYVCDTAAVIINEKLTTVGTRIFGPVLRELRNRSWLRILTMASKVI